MQLDKIAQAARGLLLAGCALFIVITPLRAQDDPAVATVNGETILRSDVMAVVATLPPQYQQQLPQIFPALVERLVDFRLIAKAASGNGLGEDKEVMDRLAKLKQDVVREVYLERQIEARSTDEALRARYDTFVAENPPKAEVRARHILLKEEAEAREVITALDGGADFAELARERSTGPSAAQGGDLGYFAAEQMVPEFSEKAFALESGAYGKDPVQTQFGWHVIKVEDRRDAAPPSFESLEQQMREQVARETVQQVVKDLRVGAEIEILPQPELPAAPAAQ